MDLTQLSTKTKAAAGAFMQLKHPGTGVLLTKDTTDEPIGITLLGTDAEASRESQRQLAQRRLDSALGTGGRAKIDATQIQRDSLELLVSLTLGWKNLTENGVSLPFSPENARRLYKDYPWIKEQADLFVADRSNFLGN